MWSTTAVYLCLVFVTILDSSNSVVNAEPESHSAKLRHRKHASLPAQYDTTFAGNTNPKLADNQKPMFTECSSYVPKIKEEEPTGLFVIQVKATDNDPPEYGGNITYSLVASESAKFHIDPYNGKITTKRMFNRDEPAREKEEYVTVRATDNGKPQLDDVCQFKVTIEDVNDNAPTFDKALYEESIPQDLSVDKEVMRISATDIDDGANRLIEYGLSENTSVRQTGLKYFKIDKKTGIVKLNREISDKPPNYVFKIRASATDKDPVKPQTSYVDLIIKVVASDKKPPYFTETPNPVIQLMENFTDHSKVIAQFTAVSNTEEAFPRFSLVPGKSEQTNKENTFRLETRGNHAYILLEAVTLDYEKLTEYSLTVRAENKHNLAAEQSVTIQLIDVNDNYPKFSDEVISGSVLENKLPGTLVMRVTARDIDVSPKFNEVTYSLEDHQDLFDIDPKNGTITTKVVFDREEQDVYNVKVVAKDGAPSSLYSDGRPNSATRVFKIEIADRNDHPPVCERERFEADIYEDADLNSAVTEVHATDKDSASTITYSIVSGNTDNAFYIEPETGSIKVKNHLDYETKTNYILRVNASDGNFYDICTVDIEVQNVNDNPPKFENFERNITIREEEMYPGCITTVKAFDPDIADRTAAQNIIYKVVKADQQKFLTINETGCLSLTKPLDRDPPNGYSLWQVLIQANDEGDASTTPSTTEVWITLIDINDNAPYLQMNEPVVWKENQVPGEITVLEAADNDAPENGKPFRFELASEASSIVRSKFSIEDSSLFAKDTFDREEQKEYRIPIAITDSGSPPLTGVSYLRLIIGDENDNPMKDGSSSIFVYYFKGATSDMVIGRVYVNDPDDWDLPDKRFEWEPEAYNVAKIFMLNHDTGMLTMSPPQQEVQFQSYNLRFRVTESPKNSAFPKHTVSAAVSVTIKEIPEEAVDKSGSIRFEGVTAEQFVEKDENGENKVDILRSQLALALNNSEENIDIFTVMHSPKNNYTAQLDVRFSAHGSPYYPAERINAAVVKNKEEIEKALGLKMLMVSVSECLIEKLHCESSCFDYLEKKNSAAPVYTNTTSFIGINAYVDPKCQCMDSVSVCLNGGTRGSDGRCQCPEGYDGPNCEQSAIGFAGNGYALYPSFGTCDHAHISLFVRTTAADALIFYIGPEFIEPTLTIPQDFMALEVRRGYPTLLVDYGTGTARVEHNHNTILDDNFHKIEIKLTTENIELIVDDCRLQECMNVSPVVGENKNLNVNGPLQVGGTFMDLVKVSSHRDWVHRPINRGFSGCIQNLTLNGHLYNLGFPSDAMNADPSCLRVMPVGIVFVFDRTFYIPIILCLAVLALLLAAVALHRRTVEDMYKDTDDIRENIINYEDEGGGEGDTAFDLNVLRLHYDGTELDKFNTNEMLPSAGGDEVPDICGFLDGKKHSVDNDPETLPFDDVRHYAYEGDGNTSGSLSSLASGTDEGDLNFDFLPNFGPRFRKLADMYGEDASDEDSDTYHNTISESWC